jgi:uncharacterized protein YdcH (DUF465 family)
MKRPSENMSPHFRELIAKFREAQARSQELARESEAFAQRIRDMQSQKNGDGRPQKQGNGSH